MTLPKGLVISAPASGTGKTTVTLGLLSALSSRGLSVQPYKCGPDYIDPAFHSAASGRSSVNLDSWSMSEAMIADHLGISEDADLILSEGSMGLFDGVAQPGMSGIGASADIAELLGWPVLLVLDASGQAQSAAAVAKGFAQMRPGVEIAGVVLNRVASPRHEALLRVGFEQTGMQVFGALPRSSTIEMPERHLGLVQAREQTGLSDLLQEAGRFVQKHIDLDRVIEAARPTRVLPKEAQRILPPAQHVALARDAAFSFVYPHVLTAWRNAGAEISFFSPLNDEVPSPNATACWLPGGYPELHAEQLAAAENFRNGVRAFAETRPVHGECGGYMALGETLTTKDGKQHPMLGLLGLKTSYAKRKMHLGYRLAKLEAKVNGYEKGQRLRGHEFHYSTILEQPDTPLATVFDANGETVAETGSKRGNVSGTFFHLVAPST